jgi:sec-independent protein translocase protein TatC
MLAAVLTPPDVITMSGLAVPLIVLYEISIIAARLVEPRK